VDVVAAVGADEQAAAVVQPGEGALDDPAVAPEHRAVLGLTAGDQGLDAALPDEPAVLVVVVAAVGDQRPRPAFWTADAAADMRHPVEQLRPSAVELARVLLPQEAAEVEGADEEENDGLLGGHCHSRDLLVG
jgi:hypothetical protein